MKSFVLFVLILLFCVAAHAEQMPLSRQHMLSSVPSDPQCVRALEHAYEKIDRGNNSDIHIAALSFLDEGFCQVYNVTHMSTDGTLASANDHLKALFQVWKFKKFLYSFEPPRENSVLWILKEFPPSGDIN